MLYFVIKCALSGHNHCSRFWGRKAQSCIWSVDRLVAAGLAIGDCVALARHRRYRADRQSRAIHVLVCPSVTADVLGALPAMLRAGVGFWASIGLNCAVLLYFITAWSLSKFGVNLW